MSVGAYDPNAVILVPQNVTLSTAANGVVRALSSSVLATKFTLVAPATKTIYIGSSSVSSTKGIPISAGASLTIGPDKLLHNRTIQYDLARLWITCTAASQTATLVLYKSSDGKRIF